MRRNISLRNKGYLVLDKKDLSFDILAEWFVCHLNDYVYVKEGTELIGVIKGKEFESRLRNNNTEILIETKFKYVDCNEENRFIIYDYFDNDLTLLRLPVIDNGVLLGEYYDTFMCKENAERYHVKNICPIVKCFYEEIGLFFLHHHISNLVVIIDKGDDYTKDIISKIPNIKVEFVNKYADILSEIPVVLDLKYPDEYRMFYNKGKNKVLLIFDIMSEVLLDAFIRYCNRYNVTLCATYAINRYDIKYLSNKDCNMMSQNKVLNDVLMDKNYLKKFYRSNPSFKYATDKEIGPLGNRIVRNNGIYNYIMDCESQYINVDKGVRKTIGIPASWEREIHIYGPCVAQGICVTDEYTVGSYLQKKLNRTHENIFKVFNHGATAHTPEGSFCNDILMAMDTIFHPGDVVIFLEALTDKTAHLLTSRKIPIFKDINMFNGTANYFLNNTYHCNHLANKKYAKLIFDNLNTGSLLYCSKTKKKIPTFFCVNQFDLSFKNDAILNNVELQDYINEVKEYRLPNAEKLKIGAICAHANPFTNGHYALTLEASQKMDHVYLFIVQDSLTALPYMDRMDIAKDAVKKLSNVTVLTTGTYMASYRTFPDYFTVAKTKNMFDEEKAMIDTYIFGKVISKILGIKYRFLGEEPLDAFTNCLNEHYLKVLPDYGITPVIIRRAKCENEYISASAVRKMVKNGNYKRASKYASEHAIQFLRRYYNHYDK